MLRGRSKDRSRKVTPPGPVYMSNEQFAGYLTELRNNRVARPSGARPPPPSKRRDSEQVVQTIAQEPDSPERPSAEYGLRSVSGISHRRAQSAMSTYSVSSRNGRQLVQQPSTGSSRPLKPSEVVPTSTYMERGQRWMEKEESVSLRAALEDMDLSKEEEEEARLHAAAQDEASELVYQHQHPEAIPQPGAPYRYKDHLRKNSYQHARSQSAGPYGGLGMPTGLARDLPPRSVSGGSSTSEGIRSRVSSGSSNGTEIEGNISTEVPARSSFDNTRANTVPRPSQKSYGNILGKQQGGSRRRSSGKRNISGEIIGSFSGAQIWEEPEELALKAQPLNDEDVPAPLRIKPRNPLNRVQFAQDMGPRSSSTPPEPTKRLHKIEIHRNPPTQSRNPLYTANSAPVTSQMTKNEQDEGGVPTSVTAIKDGLEIRSDEIRQATSMRLKDRSPKLPTPTAVSDKPGRPIVSFDKNWKPNEADDKPEVRRRSPFDRDRGVYGSQRQKVPTRSDPKDVATPVPSIVTSESPAIQVMAPTSKPPVPTINFPDSQSQIPTIVLPGSTPPVPTIALPDSNPLFPAINLPDSVHSVPTVNVPNAPTISITTPDVPTISVSPASTESPKASNQRPLPDPKTSASRPRIQNYGARPASRGHWSPAAGSRATAACHQCQLPIEGRVLTLRGNKQHFHPQCFICFTCGTGLESLEIRCEPDASRAERIDRIRRRAQGEVLPEIEGQTLAEDGDERMRFYCHLDWHENFAPRCKHCKTPIIGECTVALGEHWHYGHFFCAECGDPFEKGQTHIEKDGYAWCLNCQTKRTERQAPKCKKCRQPVIGQYIQAMGGEWHDKCFRCHECHTGFTDGAFYPRDVAGEMQVLCIRCLEMKLKA